jgi:hypothetical protein
LPKGRQAVCLRFVADPTSAHTPSDGKKLPAFANGRAWAALLLPALGAAGATLATTFRHEPPAPPPADRPIQVRSAGYVSSDTCRSCHPGNYASWHASYHRTMTQVARPENFLASNLDGLELSLGGTHYRVERAGDAFFVHSREADGREAPSQQVVLLTGSHNLQILWLATGEGRTLVQFPFAYIAAERMWAPVLQTFVAPPDLTNLYFKGEWNGACLDCHTTQARSRFVTGDTFDSQVSEFGIACEACHSEGLEHIARNRNPLRRYSLHLGDRRDPTIVNPERLDGPRSTLACGQCHGVTAFTSVEKKIEWSRDGRTFRPGQADLVQRFLVQPTSPDHAVQKQMLLQTNPHYFNDRFWGDGMLRATGREMNAIAASPCYRGGHFACVSCHEMHPRESDAAQLAMWADRHQLAPRMDTDAACLQCHDKFKTNFAAHTHHAPDSAGSACYNCHMPYSGFGLLRAVRSHQISSPTVRETLDYRRPNACNLCHLDRPLGWAAEQLHAWYGQPMPELSADDRTLAAGARWMLEGDAAVRALSAWSMGWEPAQRASGRDWLPPYLFTGMNDPYAAVRFVAWRSLKTLPGLGDFTFDYTADDATLRATTGLGYRQWRGALQPAAAKFPAGAALQPDGSFDAETFRRLLRRRDNSPVFIVE